MTSQFSGSTSQNQFKIKFNEAQQLSYLEQLTSPRKATTTTDAQQAPSEDEDPEPKTVTVKTPRQQIEIIRDKMLQPDESQDLIEEDPYDRFASSSSQFEDDLSSNDGSDYDDEESDFDSEEVDITDTSS